MANVQTIAKARAAGSALKIVFGVDPEYITTDQTVTVYYPPDKLKIVQKKYREMIQQKSDLKIDWFPIIAPDLIKNYLPKLFLIMVISYAVGKIKR